jgi:hypothetical protein
MAGFYERGIQHTIFMRAGNTFIISACQISRYIMPCAFIVTAYHLQNEIFTAMWMYIDGLSKLFVSLRFLGENFESISYSLPPCRLYA